MMKTSGIVKRLLLGSVFFYILSACDPIPDSRMVLSAGQKQADMLWLYSQFDSNYAPLGYKKATYGLDYEKLKGDFMAEALAAETNDAFYLVMNRFVAQFRDAHTSASLSHGGLKNRAKIAYLGISGKRKGDLFVVTEIFPTFNKDHSHFPIHVGDEISQIDGNLLGDFIRDKLVKFENLGQDESNLTVHMNRIFTRISTSQELPSEEDAVLTIVSRKYTVQEIQVLEEKENRKIRSDEKKSVRMDVQVPWNFKDLYNFRSDLKLALTSESGTDKKFSPLDIFQAPGESIRNSAMIGFRGFDGSLVLPSHYLAKFIPGSQGNHFLNTFYFPNSIESWTSDIQMGDKVKTNENGDSLIVGLTPLKQLTKVRHIPSNARFITAEGASFPTYVTEEPLLSSTKNGLNKTKLVATMYLSTFSPEAKEGAVIREFKKTLEDLQFYRVDSLVIDLLNNGGGSLSLGMQLAQALSNQEVEMPDIQFILSDSWLREFQGLSVNAPSDAERTLAQRVVADFESAMERGQRLSGPMSTKTLLPFDLIPNERITKKFKIVLMVNEMCASMCDIFSAILQDNKMATVLGSPTMGAGGNVVTHYQAPNSHLVIRQTESLMIRTGKTKVDRGYLENRGVQPDEDFPVTLYSDTGYKAVRQAAVRRLTRQTHLHEGLKESQVSNKRKSVSG